MEQTLITCPSCGSLHVTKKGFGVIRPGKRKQRYQCMDCGRTFYPKKESSGGKD